MTTPAFEPVACDKCSAMVEWIDAGGREYAFDADGELHRCWEALPEDADFLRL